MDSYKNYVKFTENDLHFSNYMQEAIGNYLCYGLMPGGFLTAVLANDLMGAAGLADSWNLPRLGHIANWINLHAPSDSVGSYRAVSKWAKDTGQVRSTWFAKKEKEYVWAALAESNLTHNLS